MKTLRKYHKWPSLVIGFFLILFSLSGIIMNHRPFFSAVNVSRNLMPPVYRYNNWNLASVKGNIQIDDNKQLIYGNTGVWETDSTFSRFTELNNGFGRGIDQRKVFTLLLTNDKRLFAGTLFGLYSLHPEKKQWQKIEMPEKNPRVVKLAEYNGFLFVMTRDHIYTMSDYPLPKFSKVPLSVPDNNDGKVSLFTTLWVLHSGELLGFAGKLVVDLVGIVLIFICISGFYYTLLPTFAKKTSQQLRLKMQKINRTSIRLHTKIGVYGIVILIITVITGMFLRPPLLIPIANSRVSPIPGTLLDNKNHWHDKLRDFVIDSTNNRLIFSTSEGFYETRVTGDNSCRALNVQPPVSVMGITAFDQLSNGGYVVASFSGIFRWFPEEETVFDMITGELANQPAQGNPFGSVAVSGLILDNGQPIALLDYDGGWIPLQNKLRVPRMPIEIQKSPISLWNVGLEVHTGRIFSLILGDLYILYVPLMGITTLLIIVTGFLMWYKSLIRKKNKTNLQSLKP